MCKKFLFHCTMFFDLMLKQYSSIFIKTSRRTQGDSGKILFCCFLEEFVFQIFAQDMVMKSCCLRWLLPDEGLYMQTRSKKAPLTYFKQLLLACPWGIVIWFPLGEIIKHCALFCIFWILILNFIFILIILTKRYFWIHTFMLLQNDLLLSK